MPDSTTHRYRKQHKVLKLRGGQQVAYTNTSPVTDKAVEAALRALAPHTDGLHQTIVHVKASAGRSRCGSAYFWLPSIANTEGLRRGQWHSLITCSPFWGVANHGWVSTLAHEARHIEQWRTGRFQRNPGRWREDDACAFGKWFLELYRGQLAKAVA